MKKNVYVIFCFIIISINLSSQENIDKIIAIVGNEIILKSDIENQYMQAMSQNYSSETEDLKCNILEELMYNKLLYIQSQRDSINVNDKEIEQELDRRLSVFVNQLGSEKKLEEYYNKPINEIKNDFRPIIKEQLLTQRVQATLTANTKLTPSDVKNYYAAIHKDSLPSVDAYFELSEIVFTPAIGKKEKDATIEKLNQIRERILKGENFSTLAILYSEDPGSAQKGGELGFVSRNDLVPEFTSVAFNLTSPQEVSRVVETEFGFHIIQMMEKKGNLLNLRHILLTPMVSIDEVAIAENKAFEVYNKLIKDSISFENAVKEYSDGETKHNSGRILNQYYGNSKLSKDFVDPAIRKAMAGIKMGEYSKPFLSTNNKGVKVVKIIRLDNIVEQHIANLKDDYQEIQHYAIQKENQKIISKWINSKIKNVYIKIDTSYKNCKFTYANWYKN